MECRAALMCTAWAALHWRFVISAASDRPPGLILLTIVQVLAERQPYADYRTNKGVTDAMSRDEQPLPANQEFLWPQERIGELWTACWERDPGARPSAEELRTSLESMLR